MTQHQLGMLIGLSIVLVIAGAVGLLAEWRDHMDDEA